MGLGKGAQVACKVNKGGCVMPDYQDSVLSVSLGSGISPIRSLC